MNKIIENIRNRRSVRDFEAKQIDRKILQEIIEAGAYAPSGANSQPWRFVVAESEPFRAKLAAMVLPYYKKWIKGMPEEFQKMREERDLTTPDPVYYGAPAVVFVIGKGMTSDFDCAMACQNIMLAARSHWIGSCWVYIGSLVTAEKEIKEALELKEGEKVYGPILLGFPKGGFPAAPDRKPLNVKYL